MEISFCKYISAVPADKNQTAQLVGSNSIVGSSFSIEKKQSSQCMVIKNKFDKCVAELNEQDSKTINLWFNKDLIVQCFLAYVVFDESKREHSGRFLVMAYPKKYESEYENFCLSVSNYLSCGNRPDICLDSFEHKKIIETKGAWKPKMLKAPKLNTGTAIVKGKMSFLEKIIEAGRSKNPGCYLLSILFLLCIAGGIVWVVLQFIS